ncbi:hypothetical protein BDAP_002803 [Binucleata daphniae]
MNAFISVLYINHVILLQTIDIVYHTPSKSKISKDEAKIYANLILTFSAYSQTFNVVLSDNNISNKIHLKHNRCVYSARIFGKQSYGYFDMCKETGELCDENFQYVIKNSKIDRKYQKNDVADYLFPNNELTNEKYMKIYMINDYSLYETFDSNARSYEIFQKTKQILESVKYDDHELRFVLLGVLNIAEEDILDKMLLNRKHSNPRNNNVIVDLNSDKNTKMRKNSKDIDSDSTEIMSDHSIVKEDQYMKDKHRINTLQPNNVKDSGPNISKDKNQNIDEGDVTQNNKQQIDNVLDVKVKDEIITSLNKDTNLSFITKFLCDIKTDAEDELEMMQDKIDIDKNTKNELSFFQKQSVEEKTNYSALNDKIIDKNINKNYNLYNQNVESNIDINIIENDKDVYSLLQNQEIINNLDVQNNEKAKEETQAAQKLQNYSDFFIKLQDQDSVIAQANLIIFYTLKTDLSYIEGLTYKAGACSVNDGYSLIHLSPNDSVFYQAKVTAHEILHSLNASHKCKDLMDSQGCTTCREDETKINECTINEVVQFIKDNRAECFRQVSLCGNGMLDPGEECDSGMPFGSSCCTSNCKLRKNAECDDNNGECCKDCKFVAKETLCKNENECTNSTYCTGSSASCPIDYKDNEPCKDGFCKNGKCQTKNLMCQRIGKKFSTGCDQSNTCQLVCVNDNKVCSLIASVYNDIRELIMLPDMIPCMIGNKRGRCVQGKCIVDSTDYKNAMIIVSIILAVAIIITCAIR